jgi:two-component system response regulator AtoC
VFQLPRIVSSTTRDLQGDIEAGSVREDLFYHLSAVCLRIPPLRQRKEDIAVLFEHLLSAHSAALGMQKPQLSEELISLIEYYDWPGNLRELENTAKAAVVAGLKTGLEPIRDAVAHESDVTESIPLKRAARAASLHAQRELILLALSKTSWNRKRAAEHLQISYKALLYKMREIGLVPASGKVE